jgi:hypothetical protein
MTERALTNDTFGVEAEILVVTKGRHFYIQMNN